MCGYAAGFKKLSGLGLLKERSLRKKRDNTFFPAGFISLFEGKSRQITRQGENDVLFTTDIRRPNPLPQVTPGLFSRPGYLLPWIM